MATMLTNRVHAPEIGDILCNVYGTCTAHAITVRTRTQKRLRDKAHKTSEEAASPTSQPASLVPLKSRMWIVALKVRQIQQKNRNKRKPSRSLLLLLGVNCSWWSSKNNCYLFLSSNKWGAHHTPFLTHMENGIVISLFACLFSVLKTITFSAIF